MQNKKIKVLSSILNGKINVDTSLNEYNKLKNELKTKYDYKTNYRLNRECEIFQEGLYNYFKAIKMYSEFFDKYEQLDKYLNKPVKLRSIDKNDNQYSIYQLFSVFRNKKDHFEKIDENRRYSLFKTSITMEMCLELYDICNFVMEHELNKLTEDELLKIFSYNPDVRANHENKIIDFYEMNEELRETNSEFYLLNTSLLNKIKDESIDDITFDKIESNCQAFDEYYLNSIFKKMFVERYGLDKYNDFIDITTNNEISAEEYIKKFKTLFNDLIDIEYEISGNENK